MDARRDAPSPDGETQLCCMCHERKPVDDFAFRSKATGKRQAHCRKCHAAYRRQHYLANKAEYITREVARVRGYREENRVQLRAYLEANPCVDCGETDLLFLEFDHRERSLKTANISVLYGRYSWRRVLEEIKKCDVRCVSCHRRRTAKQMGWRKSRPFQLTIAGLWDGRRVPRRRSSDPQSSGIRECTGCRVAKPISDFAYRNRATGKRLK